MLQRSDYYAEVIRLREELDEAREEIRQLRKALRTPMSVELPWRLTRTQRRLLFALYESPRGVKRECLWEMLPRFEADTREKTLDTHFCLLRRRLRQSGIQIKTLHGIGYQLTAGSIAIIKSALNTQVAA